MAFRALAYFRENSSTTASSTGEAPPSPRAASSAASTRSWILARRSATSDIDPSLACRARARSVRHTGPPVSTAAQSDVSPAHWARSGPSLQTGRTAGGVGLRGPLLELDGLGSRLQLDEQLTFQPEPFVERQLQSLEDRLLRRGYRGAWMPGDRRDPLEHVTEEAVVRKHRVHESELECLTRVYDPSGQHEVGRPSGTDETGKALGSAGAGNDPDGDLGLTQMPAGGDESQRARPRDLAAAA